MDPETKKLLEQNLELAEENNRLLRGLRTSNRLGLVFKVVYLAILAGGAVFAYYHAEPYIKSFLNAYQAFSKFIGK